MYWAGLLGLLLAACSQPQGQVTPQVAVGPAVTVTKTAVPSFKRTYRWTVEKTASAQSLTLAVGESYTLDYQVRLTADYEDSDWKVSGKVIITNPNDQGTVFIRGVNLDIGGLDCHGASFPYVLQPNQSLTCDYEKPLNSGASGTITAQVQWSTNLGQNARIFTASGSASFSFDTPTKVVDGQVQVHDSYAGPLGTVQAGESPKVFSYSREIQYDTCGEYVVDNTATFTTNTTGSQGSASVQVAVTVLCEGSSGCTRSQGYWKTHSKYGPAPRDDGWDKIEPNGEDTIFYLSGQSYIDVLHTPPKGNAYYILAHQFIAAKLNILNGADGSAVSGAMAWAEAFFNTYGPGNVPKDQANLAKYYANLLDQYNNGYIGPGHCSE
jgi:hypothetical protein